MRKIRTTFTAIAVAATMTVAPVAAEELSPVLVTADLEVSDIAKMLIGSMGDVDLSWISNYHLGLNVDPASAAGRLDVVLNDTGIGSILGYLAQEESKLYLQCPELSEEYLSVDLKEVVEEAEEESGGLVSMQLNGMSVDTSAVMDEETQEKALEFVMNYGFPFLGILGEGESTTETVSYKDKSAEVMYDGFTANAGEFFDVLTEQLEALKEDQESLDLLSGLVNGTEITAEMLDQTIEEIEKVNTEEMASLGLQINYGFSEDSSAMAGNIALVNDGEVMKLAELVAFSDEAGMGGYVLAGIDESNFRVNFDLNDDGFVGGLYIGDAGVVEAKVEIGDKSGTITISPITESESDMLAGLEGSSIVVKYADEDGKAYANVEVILSEMSLGKLEFAALAGEAMESVDLSGITAYDAMEEEELNAFMGNADLTTLMENLTAAGFGAEEEEE